MLGMMNASADSGVEFYASPSSRQIPAGDISVFSQAKRRPHVTYTKDGRKVVDGKLDESSQLKPQQVWNQLIINQVVEKQIKFEEPEIQRKGSAKKAVKSLRKFLPFGSNKKQVTKSKTVKTEQKTKPLCPTKCASPITVVE